MNIFMIITLLSSILCFSLASFIYYSNKKESLNIVFSLLCMMFSYYTFTQFMCLQASSQSLANLWVRIGFLWPFSCILFFHFILILTKNNIITKNKLIYPVLYASALFFSIIILTSELLIKNPVKEDWGFNFLNYERKGKFFIFFAIWAYGFSFLSIFFIGKDYLFSKIKNDRKIAKYILIGFFPPIIIALIQILLISQRIPSFFAFYFSWICLWIAIVIKKFKLFTINPETAADVIVETMPDALFLCNQEGNIDFVNKTAIKLFELSKKDVIGKTIDKILLYQKNNNSNTIKKELKNYDKVITKRNGNKVFLNLNEAVIYNKKKNITGHIYVFNDVSRQINAEQKIKDAQKQLIYTEKLAGIGQLAAGIAHEINNPLSFIISNLEILEEYINKINSFLYYYKRFLSSELDFAEFINKINDILIEKDIEYIQQDLPCLFNDIQVGTNRVKQIIDSLMDFAILKRDENQYINLLEIINSALLLVDSKLKDSWIINKEFQQIPLIYCNKNQILHVLFNLLLNASQAIEHENGIITIRVFQEEFYAVIQIVDNGNGIADDNISKIFDPFFTTKELGKGIGLGLSVIYGIIKNHRGTIEVTSKPGEETVFTIKLPL